MRTTLEASPRPTTAEPEDDWIHPLDAAALREPLPGAAVRVVVMATRETPDPDAIGQGLLDLIRAKGREADAYVVWVDQNGWDQALEQGLAGGSEPVVLVTSAVQPWTAAHLDPLLAAIDTRDHVVGRRPASLVGRVTRWARTMPWRVLFAVPVADPFSPCRVHRREALERIVTQSSSRFLDVEILAKATFLTQVIEEVDIPALAGVPVERVVSDMRIVMKRPTFVRGEPEPEPSLPSEEAERQNEGADGPGGEHGQGDDHHAAAQISAVEHDRAEGVEQLGERQGLDEPLDRVGKAVGREEDSREDPHRQHDQVHEAGDGLGRAGPAGDQQPDA